MSHLILVTDLQLADKRVLLQEIITISKYSLVKIKKFLIQIFKHE